MPSDALVIAAVAGGGGAGAAIDLLTRRVPNPLTFGIAALGCGLALAGATSLTPGQAIAGLAIGFALMLPGHVVGATGAGDVKLFAAIGTLLGPSRTGMAFLYTAIAGGALAVAVALRRRRLAAAVERTAALIRSGGGNVHDIENASDNRFAYAPAIAAGALVAALGW
ncbi:MAG: prepilin peptidase [Acidobacteria bacterium]|nr:prepilin peptidase [Acidobacteriota bacterium]